MSNRDEKFEPTFLEEKNLVRWICNEIQILIIQIFKVNTAPCQIDQYGSNIPFNLQNC
jgi:hypothetical protein